MHIVIARGSVMICPTVSAFVSWIIYYVIAKEDQLPHSVSAGCCLWFMYHVRSGDQGL